MWTSDHRLDLLNTLGVQLATKEREGPRQLLRVSDINLYTDQGKM